MAVSELESSYSTSDLSHLYNVEREKQGEVGKKKKLRKRVSASACMCALHEMMSYIISWSTHNIETPDV